MPLKHKKFQRLIIALAALIIIILIILYPNQSLSAALKGLSTWINVVLPALLPFFIASEIMMQLGIVDFLSSLLNPIMKPLFNCPGHSSFVWIMSITSGYPMGPKLIGSLYEDGSITRIEGQRMLAFCNTSGPLFMIGAVGIGMLGSPEAGKIIAISHYSGALILGLLLRFYGKEKTTRKSSVSHTSISSAFRQFINNGSNNGKSLGSILGDSVRNSMESQLLIGGFIILFSVIINLIMQNDLVNDLSNIPKTWTFSFPNDSQLIKVLGAGILEITTGCQLLGNTIYPLENKLVIASFIIGWGGFSIHSQAISFLANTDFSIPLYFLTKLLHGILSAIITYVFVLFSPVLTTTSSSGFDNLQNIDISSSFIASCELLVSAILGLLALLLFTIILRIVKDHKAS